MGNTHSLIPSCQEEGESNRPYPNDGSPIASSFRNTNGLRISTYSWTVPSPRGGVVLVHGLQNHCRFEYLCHPLASPQPSSYGSQPPSAAVGEKRNNCVYEGSWIHALNSAGYSVFGLDLQGHGRSEGWKGYRLNVEQFDDYAEDVILYLREVANSLSLQCTRRKNFGTSNPGSRIPPLTLHLIGVSMGGCVCVRVLQLLGKRQDALTQPSLLTSFNDGGSEDLRRSQVTVTGCVLLSPMLSLETLKSQPLNRLLMPFGVVISAIAPNAPVASILRNDKFRWIDECKERDPYVSSPMKIPARLSSECLRVVDKAQEEASLIPGNIHILLVHSKHDTMCEPQGSVQLFSNGLHHVKNKNMWMLDNMWHYLTLEPGTETLVQDIIKWMRRNAELERAHGLSSRL